MLTQRQHFKECLNETILVKVLKLIYSKHFEGTYLGLRLEICFFLATLPIPTSKWKTSVSRGDAE